jgi:pimeloyl-ACP methyl ester carboxylesterase
MDIERFWHQSLGRPYRLHVTHHGDIAKPVVILLHGIAASGEDWDKLIPLLTTQYHCITIDLLGFGRSPKPQWATYDMTQHVAAIRLTIRSLRLPGNYTLVGHSLGSLLATAYTHRFPRRINRLLLLSPPVYPPLHTIEGKLALKRTDLLMKLYKLLRTHPRMTPDTIRRLSLVSPLPRTVVTRPDTWIPFTRSLEHCIEQQTIERDIRRITIPIDIFYGSLDTVVVGSNIRALARRQDVRMHTFRGNHALGRTYAKAVADVLAL